MHENAGVAASCQTFLQFGAMAVGAGILAPLLRDSRLQLALGTGAIISVGALCLIHERQRRRTAASRLAANLST